jgi:Tfp pilus assembly protein PilF
LSLDARYEEAYLNLAELEKEENPSLSIDYLEKAIDIDPGYRAAFQLLGILLQRSGDLARAEKHFRRCVELDPLDQWSRLYLANCLAVQRKDSEAEAEYRMAVAVGVDPSAREFFARFLESRLGLEDAERVRHSQG